MTTSLATRPSTLPWMGGAENFEGKHIIKFIPTLEISCFVCPVQPGPQHATSPFHETLKFYLKNASSPKYTQTKQIYALIRGNYWLTMASWPEWVHKVGRGNWGHRVARKSIWVAAYFRTRSLAGCAWGGVEV